MKAHVKVVGMVAGGRENVVASVSQFDPVLLLPEPNNAYDAHAIAVYTMPLGSLTEPALSSLKDPERVGHLGPVDARAMIDRQAGYLPREIAATLRLPISGIVGYVSSVRYAPPEYRRDGTLVGPRPAGFDVCAWLERTDPALEQQLDYQPEDDR